MYEGTIATNAAAMRAVEVRFMTSCTMRYVAIAAFAANKGARNTHMLRVLMEMLSALSTLWMAAAVAMSPG
jgi:hypothetical protein